MCFAHILYPAGIRLAVSAFGAKLHTVAQQFPIPTGIHLFFRTRCFSANQRHSLRNLLNSPYNIPHFRGIIKFPHLQTGFFTVQCIEKNILKGYIFIKYFFNKNEVKNIYE